MEGNVKFTKTTVLRRTVKVSLTFCLPKFLFEPMNVFLFEDFRSCIWNSILTTGIVHDQSELAL